MAEAENLEKNENDLTEEKTSVNQLDIINKDSETFELTQSENSDVPKKKKKKKRRKKKMANQIKIYQRLFQSKKVK